MAFNGKYQLEQNDNFYEHLVALGVPDERAKIVDKLRPLLELHIDGDRLTIVSHSGEHKQSSHLIFNKEVDEDVTLDMTIKSVAMKRDDNKIDIFSKGTEGNLGRRTFEFFEKNMIMTLANDSDKSIPVAKRFYRRIMK